MIIIKQKVEVKVKRILNVFARTVAVFQTDCTSGNIFWHFGDRGLGRQPNLTQANRSSLWNFVNNSCTRGLSVFALLTTNERDTCDFVSASRAENRWGRVVFGQIFLICVVFASACVCERALVTRSSNDYKTTVAQTRWREKSCGYFLSNVQYVMVHCVHLKQKLLQWTNNAAALRLLHVKVLVWLNNNCYATRHGFYVDDTNSDRRKNIFLSCALFIFQPWKVLLGLLMNQRLNI